MARTNFEQEIQDAVQDFALRIVEAVKGATLQELTFVNDAAPFPAFRKNKPGPKPRITRDDEAPVPKKKRVVRNYPKCAYPDCEKNRFVRGKGFCGAHWRQFEAGEINDADFYRNLQK